MGHVLEWQVDPVPFLKQHGYNLEGTIAIVVAVHTYMGFFLVPPENLASL